MRRQDVLMEEIQLNNNGVQIDKHRIELTQQAFITYSKNQSLNAFYERSKNVNNEDLIIEKYKNLESDNYIEKSRNCSSTKTPTSRW